MTAVRRPQRLESLRRVEGLTRGVAWRCAVRACRPFRHGTRFDALPNVRFGIDGARIAAPGDSLPASADHSVSAYWRRMAATWAASTIELRIDEPLWLEYPLWSAARKVLRAATGPTQVPLLPVSSTLVSLNSPAETRRRGTGSATRDLVQVMLSGSSRWRFCGEDITVEPGEVLFVPADAEDAWCLTSQAFWLELKIPRPAPSDFDAEAEAMMVRLLEAAGQDDGIRTNLPLPAPCGEHGALSPLSDLGRVARQLAAGRLHGALRQALEVSWLQRISAHALEPVPMPAEPDRLRRSDRVRLCPDSVVRRRVGEHGWLLAVNGHVQVMPNTQVLTRLWRQLCSGEVHRVGDLIDRKDEAGTILNVLNRLLAQRGLVRAGL